MKLHLRVQKNDGSFIKLDGLDILRGEAPRNLFLKPSPPYIRGLHETCQSLIKFAADIQPVRIQYGHPVFRVDSSQAWAQLIKKLNYKNFDTCYIQIGIDPVDLVRVTDIRDGVHVHFPNGHGGSYANISQYLANILRSLPASGMALASFLQDCVKLPRLLDARWPDGSILKQLVSHKPFLKALLVLLFIVEPSRYPLMLAYSMMLLELITYSPGRLPFHKEFRWDNVFVSRAGQSEWVGQGYLWDDFERKGYGGKYPGAAHSTGKGNYAREFKILEDVVLRPLTIDSSQRQRDMVLLRGITLTLYWLKLFDKQHFVKNVQTDRDLRELLRNIMALANNHMEHFFGCQSQYIFPTNTVLGWKIIKMPADRVSIPDGESCFYYEHNNETTKEVRIGPYFHKNTSLCKLVPKDVLKKEITVVNNGNVEQHTISAVCYEERVGNARARALPCPYCYKTNHQAPPTEDKETITI